MYPAASHRTVVHRPGPAFSRLQSNERHEKGSSHHTAFFLAGMYRQLKNDVACFALASVCVSSCFLETPARASPHSTFRLFTCDIGWS